MKMRLDDVRLSFPNVFRRAVFAGEETKYGATLLLDKAAHAKPIRELLAAIASKVKTDLGGVKLPADRLCLRDGDESAYDGYAGCVSLRASNNSRPLVLNRDRTPLTEDDGVIYAGCYVNAIVELWSQDNQWGKRINCNLLGVQFVRDGDPFGDGGRVASADEFDVVSDERMPF